MRGVFLIFITLLCISAFSSEVRACQCIEYDIPVCAAFWRTDAVFVGQLAEVKVIKDTDRHSYRRLNFIVDEAFKGVSGSNVVVLTSSGTNCDLTFKKGMRYLIYATRGEADQLITGMCSRGGLVEDVDDLDYLRKVTLKNVDESISGRVQRYRSEKLQGLRVSVEGEGKTFETTTEEEGRFSVSLPGPGTFKVRVFAPFSAAASRILEGSALKLDVTENQTIIEYDLQLEKSQCDYTSLDLVPINIHATAEISGHVLTESGEPLRAGTLYLFAVASPESGGVYESLEADGSFKYRNLPAGEYYLVLNPDDKAPDKYEAPYPRTYYPGVANATEATKIVVTKGALLDNVTLRLGKPLRERVVSGTVTASDRRALIKGAVAVFSGDKYLHLIDLDEKGNFSFKVYGDFPYAIQARDYGQFGGQSELLVLVDGKSTGLKLILRRVKK